MAVPLDAIRAFHNAFRKDLANMDAAAHAAARGQGNLDLVLNRHAFFIEILAIHARGEEKFVFTAMERVAPLVAEAYDRDHRGLDELSESLTAAVGSRDMLSVLHATTAFNYFSNFHLNKEEAHLYRIFNERVPMPEQATIMGNMSKEVPPARFPEAVKWLFPLLGINDRENMVRIFKMALPAPVYDMATKLVKGAVGDGWGELVARVPELANV
jgi:hypothetical protein